MPTKIGITLADGTVLPVITTGERAPQILHLTTAHHNQQRILIDFVKERESDEQYEYLGSLSLPHLAPKQRGGPTIALQLSCDEGAVLHACAEDADTGQKHAVSLPYSVYGGASEQGFLGQISRHPILQKIQEVWRGVTISAVITLFSWYVGKRFPLVGAAVIALVAGMIIALVWKNKEKAQAGLKFTANELLQVTVILRRIWYGYYGYCENGITSLADYLQYYFGLFRACCALL